MDLLLIKEAIDNIKGDLHSLTEEELLVVNNYLDEIKYNQLLLRTPYPYQKEFMNASAKYKQRYARSGNRTGKTYGVAMEMAYHLTGLYPDWFEGERIEGSGHLFWCIGIDLDSTSKVLQKELFGTTDVRITDELGTGTIPRDCIDLNHMIKDGARITSCRIQHVSGGWNTLAFYAASKGASTLMGQAVKFIWMDEIPEHNAMEIYAQCKTRLMTTQGMLALTATPEAGMDDVNRMYAEDTTGKLYLQSISMDDAPHLTEEDIRELLSGIPECQHDMRRHGLPILGSGAVFPVENSSIECDSVDIQPHWRVIAGVDWGGNVDPTTIVFAAFDPDEGIYYVYDEVLLDGNFGELNDRSPESVARAIRSRHTYNIPVILPHDSGLKSNEQGRGQQLIRTGINVYGEPFKNPQDIMFDLVKIGARKPSYNAIEPGLEEMRRLMKHNKIKVSRHCSNWFREKNSYFYNEGKPVDKDNHFIDASRYAILSLIGNLGETYLDSCIKQEYSYTTDYSNFTDM